MVSFDYVHELVDFNQPWSHLVELNCPVSPFYGNKTVRVITLSLHKKSIFYMTNYIMICYCNFYDEFY